jgi:hypothetical protein
MEVMGLLLVMGIVDGWSGLRTLCFSGSSIDDV